MNEITVARFLFRNYKSAVTKMGGDRLGEIVYEIRRTLLRSARNNPVIMSVELPMVATSTMARYGYRA